MAYEQQERAAEVGRADPYVLNTLVALVQIVDGLSEIALELDRAQGRHVRGGQYDHPELARS